MQINVDTPIINDDSNFTYPYISRYNQVFIENKNGKVIIHHEIYPIYLNDKKEIDKTIIPNETVSYFVFNKKTNNYTYYGSLYQALREFYKLK